MNFFSKIRMSSWVILLLVGLNVWSWAILWQDRLRHPPQPAPPQERDVQKFLNQELGLNNEQAKHFQDLRAHHEEQSRALFDTIHRLKQSMFTTVFNSSSSQAELTAIAEEIGDNQAQLEHLTAQLFLDLKALCEPEQVEKLQALLHEVLPSPAGNAPPPAGRRAAGVPGSVPQEAVQACAEKAPDAACQFTAPHGQVNGTCLMRDEQLVCVPPPSLPGGRPPGSAPPPPPGSQTP